LHHHHLLDLAFLNLCVFLENTITESILKTTIIVECCSIKHSLLNLQTKNIVLDLRIFNKGANFS